MNALPPDLTAALAKNACRCAGYRWSEDALRRGPWQDRFGHPHHPACTDGLAIASPTSDEDLAFIKNEGEVRAALGHAHERFRCGRYEHAREALSEAHEALERLFQRNRGMRQSQLAAMQAQMTPRPPRRTDWEEPPLAPTIPYWWLWTVYVADCIEQPRAMREQAAHIFGQSILAYPLPMEGR